MTIELKPGRFYEDREGNVWCCYKTLRDHVNYQRAYCIRTHDDYKAQFFANGRYDRDYAYNPYTLIQEIPYE